MDLFTVDYDATDLLASVTTGAQDTFVSIAPILAVVAGIIVVFAIAPKIVALFRGVGRSRSN